MLQVETDEVVDVDSPSADDCVEVVPQEVAVPGRPERSARGAPVETVTLESEDEEDGCEPGSALEALAAAGLGPVSAGTDRGGRRRAGVGVIGCKHLAWRSVNPRPGGVCL